MPSSSAMIQQDGIDNMLLESTHILAKTLLEVCHHSIGAGAVMVKKIKDGEVVVTIRQFVDSKSMVGTSVAQGPPYVDGFSQWVTTAAKESLKTAALPDWSLTSIGPPIVKSRDDDGYNKYSIATVVKFKQYA